MALCRQLSQKGLVFGSGPFAFKASRSRPHMLTTPGPSQLAEKIAATRQANTYTSGCENVNPSPAPLNRNDTTVTAVPSAGLLQGSNKACNACNASALPQRWTTEGQPVRESCNCGAFIAAFNPREVKRWRTNHRHDVKPDPEPDKQGSQAQVEHGGYYERPDIPTAYVRTGFQAK